jgi:CRISPR-associated protein Csx10
VKHFSLMLEAKSPLAIRSDHAPVGTGSTGYITGSALAGSLASVYLFSHPDDTTMFKQLFLSGQVSYPDLFPASFKNEDMQNAFTSPVYPLPKTAQSCKRFPGFLTDKGDGSEDDPHGVRDTLLDWAMFELGRTATVTANQQPIGAAGLLRPLLAGKECTCKRPMDYLYGYYRRDDNSKEKHMSKARINTRLQAHTGINRDTGTVQEGILYHRRVFEEQSCFWGLVKIADDGLVAPFTDFIKEVGHTGLVRVGTSRTRGMGQVSLSVEELGAGQDRFAQFKKRLERFSALVREQAASTFPEGSYTLSFSPLYFALTLHSPLILQDDLLRYRGTIKGGVLAELLQLPADTFHLIYQNASTRRVSGWNELWGTPRMNEWAIDTGSVFLFASTLEQSEPLTRALFTLEEEGAGRRRAEGFGRICVSDPFHLEVKRK